MWIFVRGRGFRSAAEVAEELRRQADDATSRLRAGSVRGDGCARLGLLGGSVGPRDLSAQGVVELRTG